MKKVKITGLRAIRKASHITANKLAGAHNTLRKIENKSTTLIDRRKSLSHENSIKLEDLFYSTYPYLFPIHPALPTIGQNPSVTVFVPSLTPRGFYGGIATLLVVSAQLSKTLGYDYRVVQTSGYHDDKELLLFLADNGILIDRDKFTTFDASKRGPYNYVSLPLHEDDVIVVSAWWDAYIANLLPLKKKFVYMIQDFEPIFYNNSDKFLLSEQTYRTNNFIPLCNTQIMYDFMSDYGIKYIQKNGLWFEPAVNRSKQKTEVVSDNSKEKKCLFIYGRPSVDRNLYYHALLAIDAAFSTGVLNKNEWDCFMAGETEAPDIVLSCGATIKNKGKLSMQEYLEFASSIDLAVSLMMAPHPSYPPLELASLGAKVLTTRYANKKDLTSYSSNIVCVEPTVEALVEGIKKLTNTTQVLASAMNLETDWDETLKKPLKLVVEQLEKKDNGRQ